MQTKLKKGRTFSRPQEKLNKIYELFEDDCVCAFCDSWLYDEVAKIIGFIDEEELKDDVE